MRLKRFKTWCTRLAVTALAVGTVVAQPVPVAAATFMPGDVFIGTTGGHIQHRDSSGTLIETLNTTLGNEFDTGMCFDNTGSLYATDIYSEAISKFDVNGTLLAAKWVNTSGDANNPESCVWDALNANAYVGGPSVAQIRAYNLAGVENSRHTVPSAGGTGGTDWVDLASDQCTIFYDNESSTIRRFNYCTNTSLADFATLGGGCFALRIRPVSFEVMVACSDGAHRLSSTGAVLQNYPLGFLFALNLDSDGKSFWTAGPGGSTVYKVDIASGATVQTISTGAPVWGLTVFGELTAANPCTVDKPITATGTSITTTEGQSFAGSVATFTDPDTTAQAVDYTASIKWGDGTANSNGAITGANGSFNVDGTHTYAEEGSYPVTVTIADTDCSTNSATASTKASVKDAGLTSTCATTGVSPQMYNGPTATVTDANPGSHPEDFPPTAGSISIDWGDGTTTSGTISGPNPYTVSGSHTYSSTGPFTVSTTVTDAGGSTTSVSCSVLIFAFATSSGATFVIGDLTATPFNHVTWWSSQWAALNPMSGGPAPASMKGFAGFEDFPAVPTCNGSYTTDTGNATPPPQTVPTYMGVIVSSKITQNGSVITGNIVAIVIVKNDPGYAPSPGHTGTGTIVAIIPCP